MYAAKPPTYVFGHGLSYTSFDYRGLQVTPAAVPVDGTFTVSLDVVNTGTIDGDEVVQLYLHEQQSPAEKKRPIKQLSGFERVTIPKGENATVQFIIPAANLAFLGCRTPGSTSPTPAATM